MKAKLLVIGSVIVTAVLASACCIGPVLLAGLGLGAAGLGTSLAPYRLYFLAVSAVLLAYAWYRALRPAPAAAGADEGGEGAACCASGRARRRNLWVMAVVTVFAVAMMAFPMLNSAAVRARAPREAVTSSVASLAPATKLTTVDLSVSGMTCEGCAFTVGEALKKVPGVVDATVNLEDSKAVVTAHSSPNLASQLEKAVAESGYRAKAVPAS